MAFSFFHSVMLTAVMGICELALYGITRHSVSYPYQKAAHFHSMIIFTIFSKMLFFTIIYTCMHFLKGRQKQDQQRDNSALLLVFIPLTSVFLLVTNLLVFGINQYNQNILIHDIKKHLQSISLLNDKGEHDKITAYIRQLMVSSDLKEAARLCDHEMLNTILCQYKRQCDNKHISFHVDIRHGTTDFIADSDLTSLFGNLLDNAIEAASSIPETFIEINTVRRANTPNVL